MKKATAIFLILCCMTLWCKNIEVKPQGEYSQIKVKKQNKFFKRLTKGKNKDIDKVLKSPGDYFPPTLYLVSKLLFDKGRKDEAVFWFIAGWLRGISDADKSLDVSAGQDVAILNRRIGPPIMRYALKDPDKLVAIAKNVVEWDRRTKRNYDPRWIAVHGIESFTGTKVRFQPKEKWEAINEKARKDFLEGFQKLKKEKLKMKSNE